MHLVLPTETGPDMLDLPDRVCLTHPFNLPKPPPAL